jgi:hypothetical protein
MKERRKEKDDDEEEENTWQEQDNHIELLISTTSYDNQNVHNPSNQKGITEKEEEEEEKEEGNERNTWQEQDNHTELLTPTTGYDNLIMHKLSHLYFQSAGGRSSVYQTRNRGSWAAHLKRKEGEQGGEKGELRRVEREDKDAIVLLPLEMLTLKNILKFLKIS